MKGDIFRNSCLPTKLQLINIIIVIVVIVFAVLTSFSDCSDNVVNIKQQQQQILDLTDKQSSEYNKNTLPKSICTSYISSRLGICSTSDACIKNNGYIEGFCGESHFPDSAKQSLPSNDSLVCCVKQTKCGSIISKEQGSLGSTIYLQNDAYPKPVKKVAICEIVIERSSSNVNQLMIEFDKLELYKPTVMGECLHDHFRVYNDLNAPLSPKLCGNNTEQHLYLDFKEKNLILSIKTSALGYSRYWSLRVTQLEQGDPYGAPAGCLQSFGGEQSRNGPVKSLQPKQLNYRYDICFVKPKKLIVKYLTLSFDTLEMSASICSQDNLISSNNDSLSPAKKSKLKKNFLKKRSFSPKTGDIHNLAGCCVDNVSLDHNKRKLTCQHDLKDGKTTKINWDIDRSLLRLTVESCCDTFSSGFVIDYAYS